jgi:peptidoglycan/LPS O-acetylase OafA/YrhL
MVIYLIVEEGMLISSIRHRYFWMQRTSQQLGERITHLLEINKGKNPIAVLDGVRAIACLSVIAFHVSADAHIWDMQGLGHLAIAVVMAGDTGVTLFFLLSGFLLFLPYAKSLLYEGAWPATRQFYLRRAIRIMPAYYVSLALLTLLTHPEYLRLDHLQQLLLFLTFFMDSSQSTYQQLNGPYWTLAIEWQFYLLLPLLALAMRPLVQRGSLQRRVGVLLICLLGVIAWGVVSRYWGLRLFTSPAQTLLVAHPVLKIALFFLYGCGGGGFHGKFLEDFAVGMLAALFYVLARHSAPGGAFNKALRQLSPWLWGGGLLWLLGMALWESSRANPQLRFLPMVIFSTYPWSREICLSLGYGACLLAILFGCSGLQRMFAWAPLRWVGLLSYSLYIWHLPLLEQFRASVEPSVHHWSHPMVYGLYWVWVLLVVFPLSLTSYLLLEKPWMQLGERLRSGSGKQ